MAEENGGDQVFYDRFSERIKGGNLHRSPFEEFISHNPGTPFEDMRPDMAYDGTIGGAISDLKAALSAPTEGDNYKKVAVLPQILTRAIIDYDIDNPHDRHIQNVEEAIAIGLATFRGDYPTALSLLKQYEQSIGENALTSKAFQKQDIASWMGTEPRHSYQKAIELAFHFPQKPLLFIAMGQGATSAGMDVFLRHADITERNDSDFYVVRHSRLKKGDPHPVMTRQEAEYLREKAVGKQIVLFEEDSVTARTLQTGTDFFRAHVFPNQPVYPTTNYRASSSAYAH